MPKILIIDDSFSDAALVAGLLRKRGCECESMHDGTQVVARAKVSKPDVILLDVIMDEQNGFETCRQLKKDPETVGIPVVFLTARASENDRLWGERIGAVAHLGKPFTPEELYAALDLAMAKKGATPAKPMASWAVEISPQKKKGT